jgi:surface antigen
MKKLISCIICTAIISSCAGDGNGGFSRRDATTLLGAVGGGILGSNVGKGKGRMVGAAVGALAGAAAGSWLGENLDNPKDRRYYENNTQETLERMPVGTTSEWKNPETGTRGYTTPTRTFKNNSGMYCRDFKQTIEIDGQKAYETTGTACRKNNGTWE